MTGPFITRSLGKENVFLPVNCSAIPENLLESQLFGHMKGSFTGAVSSQEGLFQRARGGSDFSDEIGEMPLSLQPKLLRLSRRKDVVPRSFFIETRRSFGATEWHFANLV